MKTNSLKLFIVDDNQIWTASLIHHLRTQFGSGLVITAFNNGVSCLQHMNENPDIVIMDHSLSPDLNAKTGLDFLVSIKDNHPNTKVLFVTASKSMSIKLDALFVGAKEYIRKDENSWVQIFKRIENSILKIFVNSVKDFENPKPGSNENFPGLKSIGYGMQ